MAKKKKGKSTSPEVLWTVRVEQKLGVASSLVKDIFSSLRSPDPGTRKMSALFFISLGSCLFVMGYGIKYAVQNRSRMHAAAASESQKEAEHLGNFIGKQADAAKRKYSTVNLGNFVVELKRVPGQKDVAGVINMAELELVLECDSKETCSYIEDGTPQARSELTNVFTALDRDELMTREGKRKIKKALMDRLNAWLPQGKIENLYFSKLIIS